MISCTGTVCVVGAQRLYSVCESSDTVVLDPWMDVAIRWREIAHRLISSPCGKASDCNICNNEEVKDVGDQACG
jgi:hypothetical protein